MNFLKILYTVFILIFLIGCKTEELTKPLEQKILGKWEIYKTGNGNDLEEVKNPTGYREYLNDSVLKSYDYKEQSIYTYKYWVSDSILSHEKIKYDQQTGDPVFINESYQILNLDYNGMKLVLQAPAIYSTFIYKRIP